MAAKTTVKVATLTGAAKDDAFSANEGAGIYSFNVLANDPGSASLYSLAQTPGASGSLFPIEKSASLASGATIAIVNGQVEYTNGKLQSLPAGKEFTDTFTYTVRMANGALSTATATVTIIGENDEASFSGGAFTGSVTEDGSLAASGTLTVTDVDDGEAHTLAASGTTDNGSYSVDADGKWSFSANNAAIQHLGAGKAIEETFTVKSQDGTASQVVTVTVNGVNDNASISGSATGDLIEDGSVTKATGALAVSDLDDGEAGFAVVAQTALQGKYGNFTFNEATGEWTYEMDNAAVQGLNVSNTEYDTLEVSSIDGTAKQTISVAIHGADEPVVVQPPADQPADQQTVVDGSTQFVVNQGTNITNGRVVFQGFHSNETLHYTNQFTYNGFSVSDYGNDGVMDTVLKFTYQQNKNVASEDVEIILVGYTDLQGSQIVG